MGSYPHIHLNANSTQKIPQTPQPTVIAHKTILSTAVKYNSSNFVAIGTFVGLRLTLLIAAYLVELSAQATQETRRMYEYWICSEASSIQWWMAAVLGCYVRSTTISWKKVGRRNLLKSMNIRRMHVSVTINPSTLRKFMNEKGADYLAISHSHELISLLRIAKIKCSTLLRSKIALINTGGRYLAKIKYDYITASRVQIRQTTSLPCQKEADRYIK